MLTVELEIVFAFLVSMNVSEQSFSYKVLKISGFIFGLWLYDF